MLRDFYRYALEELLVPLILTGPVIHLLTPIVDIVGVLPDASRVSVPEVLVLLRGFIDVCRVDEPAVQFTQDALERPV